MFHGTQILFEGKIQSLTCCFEANANRLRPLLSLDSPTLSGLGIRGVFVLSLQSTFERFFVTLRGDAACLPSSLKTVSVPDLQAVKTWILPEVVHLKHFHFKVGEM